MDDTFEKWFDRIGESLILFVAAVVYAGLVLITFHEPADPYSTGSIPAGAVFGCISIWLASAGVLIWKGNVGVSTILCFATWGLAIILSLPDNPTRGASDPDVRPALVFFLGGFNYVVLLVGNVLVSRSARRKSAVGLAE